jgi:hypothetical protein
MSKESDQALVMLATIAGCVETMRISNSFARLDIRKAISDAFECCQKAIIEWPGFTNREWVKARREQFTDFIHDTPDKGFSTCAVAAMCERIIADLQDVASVGKKRQLLEPIVPNLRIIHDFCDPEGLNFPAYEKSDYLLDELYRIIEWKH